MGFNILIPLLIGTSLTIMLTAQIGPKVVETMKVGKIESKVIDTQDVIFESTKRYIIMMQKIPTDINELIDSGFLYGKYNDNGFGGNFEISIDEEKGILNIYTSIEDERAQTIFLNSMKNKFNPKKEGLNEFVTSFVLPMDVLHGNSLFMAEIPTQELAPDSTKHKHWYDTSNGEVILKMFDGENWLMVKGNSSKEGNSSVSNYENIAKHFTHSVTGDKKYIYDKTTNTMVEFVYKKNKWNVGNNPEHIYKKDKYGKLVLATVDCLGFSSGQTIKVEGVDYLVVENGTGTYGIKNETNLKRASTLCTSNVTDMKYIGFDHSFNEDISKWDTSNVKNMQGMFESIYDFNQPLNDWDVSNVTNMESMFSWNESFNQPLNNWNVSNVKDMSSMFSRSQFNQNINSWNVSNVTTMESMFRDSMEFNNGCYSRDDSCPLNNWNVSNVKDMSSMFSRSRFNQNINSWNTSKVTNMESMFEDSMEFNQNISNWNVSNVYNSSSFDEGTYNWQEEYKPIFP